MPLTLLTHSYSKVDYQRSEHHSAQTNTSILATNLKCTLHIWLAAKTEPNPAANGKKSVSDLHLELFVTPVPEIKSILLDILQHLKSVIILKSYIKKWQPHMNAEFKLRLSYDSSLEKLNVLLCHK